MRFIPMIGSAVLVVLIGAWMEWSFRRSKRAYKQRVADIDKRCADLKGWVEWRYQQQLRDIRAAAYGEEAAPEVKPS